MEKEPSPRLPSKKQLEVFRYIKESIDNNVFSPSYREIRDALGLKSVSPVAMHVNALIALGYLEKQDNAARSLRVLKDIDGAPVESEQVHLEWLRRQIKMREADQGLSKETAILKAALTLLDQSEDK